MASWDSRWAPSIARPPDRVVADCVHLRVHRRHCLGCDRCRCVCSLFQFTAHASARCKLRWAIKWTVENCRIYDCCCLSLYFCLCSGIMDVNLLHLQDQQWYDHRINVPAVHSCNCANRGTKWPEIMWSICFILAAPWKFGSRRLHCRQQMSTAKT